MNGGNLSDELTSFIGRRRESAEVRGLLADCRLVTLTGVGGVGKTRLALQVAAGFRRAAPAEAWFVDLTELPEPGSLGCDENDTDTLACLVATTLGLREHDGDLPLRRLTAQLAARRMLLVLDNCEKLLPACAAFTAVLLRTCPDVRVLATSRDRLAVDGERCYAVLPLPAPEPAEPLSEMDRYDAVALFAARARAVMPSFQINERNWPAVADLCRRLDGLPLAIELAAARVRVLTCAQILDRLTDRFALLTRGSWTSPVRQQTLRCCVDWSFASCSPSERLLWARLAVFAGGCELDAIEDVCTDDELPRGQVLDLVAGLVDKSVLVRGDTAPHGDLPARYRMLETIRDYGHEKLVDSGELTVLRRRHSEWCTSLVSQAAREWIGARQSYWHSRLTREHANVRAAMDHYLAGPDEADAALRIAVTVPSTHWWRRGLFGESRRWLDRALAAARTPTTLRARALLLNAHLTLIQGDTEAGNALLERGETLTRRLDHATVEVALAAYVRGVIALYGDDPRSAIRSFERVLAVLPVAVCPEAGRAMELRLSGSIMLGVAAASAGLPDRADACHRDVLAISAALGEGHYQAYARWPLALTAWRQGRIQEAATQLAGALRLKRGPGAADHFGAAQCLECLAWIAGSQQRYRRAATLLGAAGALWAGSGLPVTGFQHLVGYHDACERQIRDALGDAAFTQAHQTGQALAYNDAIAFALDEERRPAPAPADQPNPLTRREQEVAELLGRGLSNKEIAAKLIVSQRTAESHVEHILAKLNLNNRTQVAAWVTMRRSPPVRVTNPAGQRT